MIKTRRRSLIDQAEKLKTMFEKMKHITYDKNLNCYIDNEDPSICYEKYEIKFFLEMKELGKKEEYRDGKKLRLPRQTTKDRIIEYNKLGLRPFGFDGEYENKNCDHLFTEEEVENFKKETLFKGLEYNEELIDFIVLNNVVNNDKITLVPFWDYTTKMVMTISHNYCHNSASDEYYYDDDNGVYYDDNGNYYDSDDMEYIRYQQELRDHLYD